MATRKNRINRGSYTMQGTDRIAYFYAQQLVDAFDIAPASGGYYEVGVPMPGGHNRYEVRVDGIGTSGITWVLSVDTTGSATQTYNSGTDAGWTELAVGLGALDSIAFGEGPDLGVIKSSVFTALPAQSIVGFRVLFEDGDPTDFVIRITGVSVRGAVA